jgi:hypothetical protein
VIVDGDTCDWSTSRRAGGDTSLIAIVPLLAFPQPFETGGGAVGAAFTTALGTDVELLVPSLFFAVTVTRSVLPLSTAFSTYVLEVAPLMLEQLPPSVSQRRH